MADKQLVEVWIAMNEDGQFRADDDRETAVQNLLESEGATAMRVVCVQLMMAPPDATVVGADVPDEAGEVATVEVK